jgi:ABC-type transport system involved in multi-copper enzyme maturation permease subunit
VNALVRTLDDRLSPILVKELRQGVRSNVFTGAFLMQQLTLLGTVGLGLISEFGAQASTGFFWFFVTIQLLIVLPLSTGGCISGERTAGTLEPMLLTDLTARRIAFGKWAAVIAQTFLIVTATLPYLLVRYFMGGVDPVEELLLLGGFFVCSMLLCSFAVAISPAPMSPLFRWLLLGILGWIVAFTFFGVFTTVVTVPTANRPLSWALAAVVLLSLLLALETSSLQVAPASRARPGLARMLALLLAALCGWLVSRTPGDEATILAVWSATLLCGTTIFALCQSIPPVPSLYAPYLKAASWRRLLAPFLTPGWPAGVGFVMLLALGLFIVMLWSLSLGNAVLLLTGALATVLLPLALRFRPEANTRFVLVYLLVQMVSFACSTLSAIGYAVESDGLWRYGDAVLGLCPLGYALENLVGTPWSAQKPHTGLSATVFWTFSGLVLLLAFRNTWLGWKRVLSFAPTPAVE